MARTTPALPRNQDLAAMGLFRADFFRSLAAGFVLGALGLVAVMSTANLTDTVAPPAVAAQAEQN